MKYIISSSWIFLSHTLQIVPTISSFARYHPIDLDEDFVPVSSSVYFLLPHFSVLLAIGNSWLTETPLVSWLIAIFSALAVSTASGCLHIYRLLSYVIVKVLSVSTCSHLLSLYQIDFLVFCQNKSKLLRQGLIVHYMKIKNTFDSIFCTDRANGHSVNTNKIVNSACGLRKLQFLCCGNL
jgi:hypothetical protein